MYKFLASLLCFNCADAMDNPSHPSQWFEGLKIACIHTPEDGFYEAILCTDESFTREMLDFELTEAESTAVQNLPQLTPTLLPISHTNEPLFSLSSWFIVDEGEGGILYNPTEQHIFATPYLMHCVGVAILAPRMTVFAHITEENIGTLTKVNHLIGQVPSSERAEAKVVLVTSQYTTVLSTVYKLLKNSGFINIAGDIEPIIPEKDSCYYFLKATALKSALEKGKETKLEHWQDYIQQYCPVAGARVLIINAKTAEVYSLKPRHERHLETDILWDWKEKHQLFSNFPNNRFYLEDLEEKYNAEQEPDRDKIIKALSGKLRNEGDSMEQLKEWIVSSNLLGFNPWKKD